MRASFTSSQRLAKLASRQFGWLVGLWLTCSSDLCAQRSPALPAQGGQAALEEAMKQRGQAFRVSPEQLREFTSKPGFLTLEVPTSSGMATPAGQLSSELQQELRRRWLGRGASIYRVIGGPDFNAFNPSFNQSVLGDPATLFPDVFWSDERKTSYWISRQRPLLAAIRGFTEHRTRYTLKPPSQLGMEAELESLLRSQWEALQRIARSVVRLEPLQGGGSGSAVLLDANTLLTAGHIAARIQSSTKMICQVPAPARAYPCQGKMHIEWAGGRDMATLTLDEPVPGFESHSLVPAEADLRDGMFLATLGCPPAFGAFQAGDPLFERLFGPPGAVYVSPGLIRQRGDLKRVKHDCSTEQGSSGSPIFALPGLQLIGVQVGGHDDTLNEFESFRGLVPALSVAD